jgi:ubiquinone/menaquinone biosynthesis C-methylase UbiE
MLEQAGRRASDLAVDVDLREMDVQELPFPDESFDTVFATFVFCGVPDPVLGLDEMRRVCRKGGRMVLLEHLRPRGWLMGTVFDVLDPVVVRLAGSHVNRRTVDNVREAGWTIEREDSFFFGIVRWLEAVR